MEIDNIMETIAIQQPIITTIEYELLTLTITFDNGSVMRYFNVFPSLYLEFIQSEDKESFLNTSIKGRYYGMKIH